MRAKEILQTIEHRNYPLPQGNWIMRQSWHELLFAHWPIAPEALRPLMPSCFDIDTFDGQAWVGVVPFRMSDVRPRGLPSIPPLSNFPELNVRTYVTANGKPGVFSLVWKRVIRSPSLLHAQSFTCPTSMLAWNVNALMIPSIIVAIVRIEVLLQLNSAQAIDQLVQSSTLKLTRSNPGLLTVIASIQTLVHGHIAPISTICTGPCR